MNIYRRTTVVFLLCSRGVLAITPDRLSPVVACSRYRRNKTHIEYFELGLRSTAVILPPLLHLASHVFCILALRETPDRHRTILLHRTKPETETRRMRNKIEIFGTRLYYIFLLLVSPCLFHGALLCPRKQRGACVLRLPSKAIHTTRTHFKRQHFGKETLPELTESQNFVDITPAEHSVFPVEFGAFQCFAVYRTLGGQTSASICEQQQKKVKGECRLFHFQINHITMPQTRALLFDYDSRIFSCSVRFSLQFFVSSGSPSLFYSTLLSHHGSGPESRTTRTVSNASWE